MEEFMYKSRETPLTQGSTIVRSPTFVRWLVITLGWICAETLEFDTVRIFPVMLQLVPEVPVSPEEDIVRCCEKPDVTNNKIKTQTLKNCLMKGDFLKFFSINYWFNELWIGENRIYFKQLGYINYGKNTVWYKLYLKKFLKFNKVQSKQIIYLNNLLFVWKR